MRKAELVVNLLFLFGIPVIGLSLVALIIWPTGVMGFACLCFVLGIVLLARSDRLFRRPWTTDGTQRTLSPRSLRACRAGWMLLGVSLLLNVLSLWIYLRRHGLP